MIKIFVSYSRADTKKVSQLIGELEAAGNQVWVDRAGIRGGEIWRREIVNAVDASDVMVLVLSSHSVESDNVRKELDLAELRKLRILPVAIEPVTIPPDFLYQLVGIQRIDLYKDYHQGLNELLSALGQEQPQPKRPEVITRVDKTRQLRFVWIMIGFFLLIVVGIAYYSSNQPKGVAQVNPDQVNTTEAVQPQTPTREEAVEIIRTTEAPSKSTPRATPTPAPTSQPTITPQPSAGATLISNEDEMVVVYVPSGEFLMGAGSFDTVAESIEKPQHPVYLDAFWIDQSEVTNSMFAKFISKTGYRTTAEKSGSLSYYYDNGNWLEIKGADWSHPSGPESSIDGKMDHPVVNVSWEDASTYCAWAGRRLPTEAEWEKSARGDDQRTYPWGNSPADTNLANFNELVGDTTAVFTYPDGVSPYGVYDMAGNVWEWVSDWYADGYYGQSDSSNPAGPSSGSHRVVRSGSYINREQFIRTTNRHSYDPSFRSRYLGFRCTMNASP